MCPSVLNTHAVGVGVGVGVGGQTASSLEAVFEEFEEHFEHEEQMLDQYLYATTADVRSKDRTPSSEWYHIWYHIWYCYCAIPAGAY